MKRLEREWGPSVEQLLTRLPWVNRLVDLYAFYDVSLETCVRNYMGYVLE